MSSSKRTRTSEVWDYFRELDGGQEVQCLKCELKMQFSHGSTNSMGRHLDRKHGIDLAVGVVKKKGKPDSNQETITACVKRAEKLSPDSKKYKDITYKIAKCMFLDLRPISICEDEGFREAILAAEPRYTIPSRVSYRYTILPELYNQCRGEVKNRIQRYRETYPSTALFGVTTDGWTSGSNQSIVAYTLHIINEHKQIESFCIGTYEMSHKHTAHNLQAHLLATLQEWEVLPPSTSNTDGDNDGGHDDSEDEIEDEDNFEGNSTS